MEFKKLVLVLVITSIILVGGMWGTSYAYYTSTGGTSFNVTTSSDVDPRLTVVFNQSEYMNMRTGVPINSSDVDNYASKSVFRLIPDSNLLNGYDVAVNISLVDINIDSALRVNDFNYKLTCNNGTTDSVIGSGTGISFTDDVIKNDVLNIGSLSTTDGSFNSSLNYTCTFRVWLLESGSSQNDLMDKRFGAFIRVGTAMKKK